MPSVMHTTKSNPASAGFHDSVRGHGRRHEDYGGIGSCFRLGLGNGIKDGNPQDFLAALARGHTGHDLGAIFLHALRMKPAFRSGNALHNHSRILVNQYAHDQFLTTAATFSAASLRSPATLKVRPDSFNRRRPSSTLVPSRRMIIGT